MHNAFYRFINHLSQMKTKNTMIRKIDEAAQAKHFLDDVSVGLHVNRGTVFQKYKEIKVHSEFEDFIHNNIDSLIKNYKKTSLSRVKARGDDDFENLFLRTVNASLKNEIPDEANKSRWMQIAQKSVNLNLDASREFFNLIFQFFK